MGVEEFWFFVFGFEVGVERVFAFGRFFLGVSGGSCISLDKIFLGVRVRGWRCRVAVRSFGCTLELYGEF